MQYKFTATFLLLFLITPVIAGAAGVEGYSRSMFDRMNQDDNRNNNPAQSLQNSPYNQNSNVPINRSSLNELLKKAEEVKLRQDDRVDLEPPAEDIGNFKQRPGILVTGDLFFNNAHIRGTLASGGNGTFYNSRFGEWSDFWSQESAVPDHNSYWFTRGNLAIAGSQVKYAYVYSNGQVTENRRVLYQQNHDRFWPYRQSHKLPDSIEQNLNQAVSLSDALSALQPDNTWARRSGTSLILHGDCKSDVQVFQVQSGIFNRLDSVQWQCIPENAAVIVNVLGKRFSAAQLNFTTAVSNPKILVNLPEAETLELNDFKFHGHLIAPKADAQFNIGLIRGSLTVKSLNANYFTFIETPRILDFTANDPQLQITSTPDVGGIAGFFQYQLQVKQTGRGSLRFVLVDSPPGVEMNSSTGLLTWATPIIGDFQFGVLVTNGRVTAQQYFMMSKANDAPVWSSSPITEAEENVEYIYQLVATDSSSDQIQFNLVQGPEGMAVSSSGTANELRWRPTFDQAGDYQIQLSASDGQLSSLQEFTIHVKNGNRLPVLTSTPISTAKEGQDYLYQLSATDADGDKVYYRSLQLPEGMSLDGETGKLTWTPTLEQAGDYQITILVSDSDLTQDWNDDEIGDRQEFTLTVAQTNRAPVITTPNLAAGQEGQAYQAQINVTDPDGDEVSLELVQAPQGMQLIPQSSSDQSLEKSWLLQWTPTFSQAGTYSIKLMAQDIFEQDQNQVGIKVEKTLTLQIANVNRPPAFSLLQTNLEGQENQALTSLIQVTDPDLDPVHVTIKQRPEGLVLVQQSAYDWQLNWTPTFTEAGEYQVTLELQDLDEQGQPLSQGAISKIVQILIANVNQPPAFTTATGDVPVTATENNLYTAIMTMEDLDGDLLTAELINPAAGMALSVVDAQSTQSQSQSQSQSKTPTSTSANTTSLSQINPQTQALQLSWTPDFNQSGTHPVIIQIADAQAQVQLQTSIEVANSNRAPTWTTPAPLAEDQTPILTGAENQTYQASLAANDEDGDDLQFSIAQGPEGLQVQTLEKNIAKLQWTPTFEQAGKHQVTMLVTDGTDQTPLSFELEIANTNRQPVFTSTPVTNGTENNLYQYQITAEDPDGDAIRYSLRQPESLLQDLDLNKDTHLLSWTPSFDAAGVYPLVIEIVDLDSQGQPYSQVVSQTFDLTIANTNRPPVFESTPVTAGVEGSEYQYQLLAKDPDNQTLVYQLVAGPEGLLLTQDRLSWTPDFQQAGDYSVIVSVSDGQATVEQSFVLKISNTNQLPVFATQPPEKAQADEAFEYTVKASDPDGDSINFTLQQAPTGMTLANQFELDGNWYVDVLWTPSVEGTADFSILATDAQGAVATQDTHLTIDPPANTAPSITSNPPEMKQVDDSPFSFQVVATDEQTPDQLHYSLSYQPVGMTINDQGLISWTPTTNTFVDVLVTVTDPLGAFDQQSISMVFGFADSDAPDIRISYPQNQQVLADSPFQLQGEIFSEVGIKSLSLNGQPLEIITTASGRGAILDQSISFEDSQTQTMGVLIKATDIFDRTTEKSLDVYLDNQDPQIEIEDLQLAPYVNKVTTNPYVIQGQIQDVRLASASINGAAIELEPGSQLGEFHFRTGLDLTFGVEQAVRVTATDEAGNQTHADVIIQPKSAISLEWLQPVAGSQIKLGTSTLKVTAKASGLQGDESIELMLTDPQGNRTTQTLAPASGFISGQVSLADAGDYTLTLKVFDGANSQELLVESSLNFAVAEQDPEKMGVLNLQPAAGELLEPNGSISFFLGQTVALSDVDIEVTQSAHGLTYVNRDAPGISQFEAKGYVLEPVNLQNEPVAGELVLTPNQSGLTFYPLLDLAYDGEVLVTLKLKGEVLYRGQWRVRPRPTFVQGFVLDTFGQGIDKIQVVYRHKNTELKTLTDSNGTFGFGFKPTEVLEAGEAQIIINGQLQNTGFSNLETSVNLEAGRLNQLPSMRLDIVSDEIGFQPLKAGADNQFNAGEIRIGAQAAQFQWPVPQELAQFQFHPRSQVQVPASKPLFSPIFVYVATPKGIAVDGQLSLDVALPEYQGARDYLLTENPWMLFVGYDSTKTHLTAVGVGQVINGIRLQSRGPVAMTSLDYIGIAILLPDRYSYAQDYADGNISLEQLRMAVGDFQ